ncbi:MAG TPA: hypothetical protein VJ728_14670 [Candidatus Binataceae bacterium]|nr:hypothetical protein [Candidatus Binataceae bacterium]
MPTGSFLAKELTNFLEAVWLDLPFEAGKIMLGVGNEKAWRKAGWKAYDAWIALTNELTNMAYADPIIGEATGRVMEAALRLREINGTIAGAFFGNLWPILGLPTQREMIALREDLLALREELATYAARLPVSADAASPAAQGTSDNMWNGRHLNGNRPQDGHGVRHSANQVRHYVAA